VCIPARVSLATGLYPHDLGLWSNRAYTLDAGKPIWMREIREAGYRTSLFGKTHLHPQRGDLRQKADLLRAYGFDDSDEIAGPKASLRSESSLTELWKNEGVYETYRSDLAERAQTKRWLVRPSPLPLELYADVYIGRRAVGYLRSYDGDRPWFCWVGFTGPHEPWDAPEPYASRYDPAAMPPPVQPLETRWDRPTGALDDRMRKRPPLDGSEVARMRANYAGKVTLIDDQVGALLSVIDDRGETDRTVVAFVSDHGEMNGDHQLLYKNNFLNPAARVPFIVRLPAQMLKTDTGGVTNVMLELMDLGATLVELAGAKPVRGSLARSAVGVLEDASTSHRDVALSELRREFMLATPDWKIVRNRDGAVYLLYDLRNDPCESHNLAGLRDYGEIEADLSRQLDRMLNATR
jgi:arylsulfatase